MSKSFLDLEIIQIDPDPAERRGRINFINQWIKAGGINTGNEDDMWRYATSQFVLAARSTPTCAFDLTFPSPPQFLATLNADETLRVSVTALAAPAAVPFMLVSNAHNRGTICVNVSVVTELRKAPRHGTHLPANATPVVCFTTPLALTDISTRLNYEAEQGWQVVAGVSLVYGTHNMYWLVRRTETKQLTFDLTQSAPFLDFIWFGTASLMLAGGDTADRIQSVEQLTVKERPGVVTVRGCLVMIGILFLVIMVWRAFM